MARQRNHPLGARNVVGAKVERIRRSRGYKQKEFVALLQSMGMDIGDTSMSRLEGQLRAVQDYEVSILARALDVSVDWLLDMNEQ